MDRRAAMNDYDFKADQKEELERRLATARRVAVLPVDPLTKERVDGFIQELEVELGEDQRTSTIANLRSPVRSGTRCPRCRSRAAVQSASELRPGVEFLTLRCFSCGLVYDAQVQSDPTKFMTSVNEKTSRSR
jgi:hypothetical protein